MIKILKDKLANGLCRPPPESDIALSGEAATEYLLVFTKRVFWNVTSPHRESLLKSAIASENHCVAIYAPQTLPDDSIPHHVCWFCARKFAPHTSLKDVLLHYATQHSPQYRF